MMEHLNAKGEIRQLRSVGSVSGLTLIELLVVIALIGILASVASTQLAGTVRHMSVKRCAEQISADIKLANATARAQGQRAMVAITSNSARDLGNGKIGQDRKSVV
jgi:type II secretion system protein H